jgi:hypothetical protein
MSQVDVGVSERPTTSTYAERQLLEPVTLASWKEDFLVGVPDAPETLTPRSEFAFGPGAHARAEQCNDERQRDENDDDSDNGDARTGWDSVNDVMIIDGMWRPAHIKLHPLEESTTPFQVYHPNAGLHNSLHHKTPDEFMVVVLCATNHYSWQNAIKHQKCFAAVKDDEGTLHWACMKLRQSHTDMGDTDEVWYDILHSSSLEKLAKFMFTSAQIAALFQLSRAETRALGL